MLNLAERVLAGDRRALARALSLAEAGGPEAHTLLAQLYPHTGRAHTVGITGPPGAGKSTLVAALAREWRTRGVPVAILAIDPSSPLSGGALLGDRIRMQDLGGDPGVFIRSMASRGRPGGLASAADAAVALLDAAGFPIVLIETVGAGQGDVAIARSAQTTIVVEVPGLGDDIQAIKAGILEVADLLVVNKADLEGAIRTAAHLREALTLVPATGWEVPVILSSATQGQGIPAIIAAAEHHRRVLGADDGSSARQRAAQAIAAAAAELAAEYLRAAAPADWDAALAAVAAHRSDPRSAALELLRSTGRHIPWADTSDAG